MNDTFIIGESDLNGLTQLWETYFPAWIIIYCTEGEAEISLQFRQHQLAKGDMAIIMPDMFPSFALRSEKFKSLYCIIGKDLAEQASFGISYELFDNIYIKPVIPTDSKMDVWINILQHVYETTGNPYRYDILTNTISSMFMDFFHLWQLKYGNLPTKMQMTQAEMIYLKFCNLVLENFREHRDTAFYADRLCITANYLAMITRKLSKENPKQAINSLVILEMKHLLKNTTLTAEQIASHMHFADTSYLCRFFRKYTGLSLSEYRAQSNGQDCKT